MALTIGELVGYIDLDDRGFGKGLDQAGQGLDKLGSVTSGAMSSVESAVSSVLAKVEQDLASGFDPAPALADLDRLVAGFASDMDRMEAEARQGGAGIVEQLRRALDDAEDVARREGEDAGQGFGDGLDGAGKSRLSGVGNGFMTTLKGLGWAAAGAAIGAALMAGLESALDAEKAKAKLFAQVGASEEEMRRLGDVAGRVYADAYGESMSDVADALKGLIQNVDDARGASDEWLTTMSKQAMDVATILDQDVGAVTGAVGQMLRTGVATSAQEAFDVIVRGAQLGLDRQGDLLDTLNEYSTHLRAVGIEGPQALGLVAQAMKAGARDSDQAADAIKEFVIEAVAGGDRVKGGFKSIGLNADEMVRKFAKGGPTAAAAFDQVLDKLRGIEDPVKRNAAAVELFGTKSEDLQAALLALDPSSAVDALGQVDGVAKTAGDTLHDTAANRLESFKRGLQQNVVDFLGGTVLPALEGLADKFDLSGVGEKLGPVVDQVKGFFSGLFGSIQQWVSDNQDTIQGWADKIQGAFEAMSSVVGSVVDVITALWEEFGDDILNILGTLVDTLLGVWSGLWKAVEGVFDVFAGIFTGDWRRVWDGVKSIFSGVWDAVKSILSGALGVVQAQVSNAWTAVKELTTSAWNALKTTVSTAVGAVVGFMKRLPSRIIDALGNVGGLLFDSGKKIVQGLIDGIKSMIGAVGDAISDVVNKIKDHLPFSPAKEGPLSGRGNPLYSGQSIARLLAEGIASGEGLVAGAVGRLAGAVSGVSVAVPGMAAPAPGLVQPMSGPSPAPAFGGGFGQAPPSGGVVVNMPNAVIREEADIGRLGAEFAFQYRSRG